MLRKYARLSEMFRAHRRRMLQNVVTKVPVLPAVSLQRPLQTGAMRMSDHA